MSLVQKKYNQELALQRMIECITNGINQLEDIAKTANIDKSMVYYYLKVLRQREHIFTTKKFDNDLKKYILRLHLTDNKFEPKSIEQLEEIERKKHEKRRAKSFTGKGPYDDLIQSNPNLKLYKPFENGYKNVKVEPKVNRRPGSSFAIYDMY